MKRTVLGAACALILIGFTASEANAQHYYSYRNTPSGGYYYEQDAIGNYHYRTWTNPLPAATFTLGGYDPVPADVRPYRYYTPPPAAYVPTTRYYPAARSGFVADPGDDIICVPRRYVRGAYP